MANTIKFIYGTEASILALTPNSSKWVERAFYYPEDKTYFYQALNGVMKKYFGDNAEDIGCGVRLNGAVMGGVKTFIEDLDVLEIPENYDYNTFNLQNNGVINLRGNINFL